MPRYKGETESIRNSEVYKALKQLEKDNKPKSAKKSANAKKEDGIGYRSHIVAKLAKKEGLPFKDVQIAYKGASIDEIKRDAQQYGVSNSKSKKIKISGKLKKPIKRI
jgi:hypothetical protein